MKKLLPMALTALCCAAPLSFAGGKGGTELAIASYGDIGVTFASGLPLNIEFLRANGIGTYGELEVGVGMGNGGMAIGAELAGGLIISVAQGLSVYASLGPSIGFNDGGSAFNLGAELGLNVDVNNGAVFIEGGSHAASNYVAVGLRL